MKASVAFKAGQLPRITPDDPRILISIGGIYVTGRVSAKAARKAAQWAGPAVLQGRLCFENGGLAIQECGFQFLDPKPAEAAPSGVTSAPTG